MLIRLGKFPKLNKRARQGFRLTFSTLRSEATNKCCCLAVLHQTKKKQDPRTFRESSNVLKPFLEFKCYLILIYIYLISIGVKNDNIYFYCLLCVVVFTNDKKLFSTMPLGKIPWLVQLGRVRLMDTICAG